MSVRVEMPNGDPRDGVFYHILTRIMNPFSCPQLNTAIYVLKRLPEVPEYAEMRHDMMTSLNDHAREFQYNQCTSLTCQPGLR